MNKNADAKAVWEPLSEADYKVFCQRLEKAENLADGFVEIEDRINEHLEDLKSQKKDVEHQIKMAMSEKDLARSFLVRYIEERGIDKAEGVKAKSVNYQPAKTTIETVVTRQIKVGTRYQNLDDVSRETLVEMLEELGVRTREVVEKVEVTKPSSVRVMR